MQESNNTEDGQSLFSRCASSDSFRKAFLYNVGCLRPYLLIIVGLLFFVPWFPLVSTIDYEYGMHLFASKGWQYGADIISTYGPLGFLCLPFYHPSTYLTMITANICLYFFMVIYLWRFWRMITVTDSSPVVWITVLLILPAFKQPDQWASALFMPFILINLFTLWHFLNKKPPSFLLLMPLVVIMGAFILVKATFISLIAVGIAVVAWDQMLKWRRLPWLILVFIATVAVLWALSGQKLTNLPSYFSSSLEVVAGYKDGMSLSGSKDWASAPIFVMASLSITGYLWWVLQKRIGWRSIYPVGVFAATLFVTFQHGFVRSGYTHTIPAYLTFFILWLLVFPLMREFSMQKGKHRFFRNFMIVIAVISICGMFLSGDPKWQVLYQRPHEFWKLISQGEASLQSAAADNLQRIKKAYPLPQLKEPVDPYAIDFGLAEAYGLQSNILPSVSGYVAYTPFLSRLNRKYIENPIGPATILVKTTSSIDGRYPTVTDSLSLLGLKSHFQAIRKTDELLILERREHPLHLQFLKLEERNVSFNEKVQVPVKEADIFVQIDIKTTLLGKLLNLLFKLPPALITIDTGAQKDTYRLTTSLAKEGMILSPLLNSLSALQSFYGLAEAEPPATVSSFQLECKSIMKMCYSDRIRVTFFKLTTKK